MLRFCVTVVAAASILRAQPESSGCALNRAVQLHQSGDLPGAVREYQACLTADPNRVEVRSNLGAVYARLGRYQEAIDQYRQAIPHASPVVAPRLRFNLALAYYKSLQIPQAVAELEPLYAAQPQDVNLALLLADCRLQTGEFQKAVELLLPLEASQADNDALNYVLGMALLREGRVPEGQQRVDRILRRGDSAEGHFLLGSALFMARNYPGAVQELAKAVEANPNLPSLQSFYGQALLATGDPDGAASAFRRELKTNPNDYDANFQLASILAFRGQKEESKSLLERAAQVRPASIEARSALARGFRFDAGTANTGGLAVGSLAPAAGLVEPAQFSRPTVLVFGSYTCPKLRMSASAINQMYEKYHDRVDFRLVYIREAHSGSTADQQWQSTINQREGVDLKPARSQTEKQEYANLCRRKLSIPYPALVDALDGAAERAYDAWPSRVYLVGSDGRVSFNGLLGELDFHPAQLESAIRETLAKDATRGGPR